MIMDNEKELKTRFARLLIDRPTEPYTAMCELFADRREAFAKCELWARDPFVLAEKARLEATLSDDDLLPTKGKYLLEVLKYARDMRLADPKIAFQYDNLYAQMRGHVEKAAPSSTTNNVQLNINRVMRDPDFGSDENYAITLEAQQKALADDASS